MQISDQLWTSAEAIKLIKCSVWRYSGKIHMYHRKTNSKHIDRSKSFVNIWAEKRRIMAWTCELKCQSFIGNNNHHNYDIHSVFLTIIHYGHTFHYINSVVGHLGLQARWQKVMMSHWVRISQTKLPSPEIWMVVLYSMNGRDMDMLLSCWW